MKRSTFAASWFSTTVPGTHWGKDSLFNEVLKKLDIHMQKDEVKPSTSPYTKATQNVFKRKWKTPNYETTRKHAVNASRPFASGQRFLGNDLKSKDNKNKNRQAGSHRTKTLLCNKQNKQQNRIGENICKLYIF
jgi:hypothetical protein